MIRQCIADWLLGREDDRILNTLFTKHGNRESVEISAGRTICFFCVLGMCGFIYAHKSI